MKIIGWQISQMAFCLLVIFLVWGVIDFIDQKFHLTLEWIIIPTLLLTMALNFGSFIRYRQAEIDFKKASANCEQALEDLRASKEKFDKCLDMQISVLHSWIRGATTCEQGNFEATEHFLAEIKKRCNEMKAVLEEK